MPKLSSLPTSRVLKALARAGWQIHEGAKHYKLLHLTKPGALTVPRSSRLKKGTLRAIIRQAGVSLDGFFALYR